MNLKILSLAGFILRHPLSWASSSRLSSLIFGFQGYTIPTLIEYIFD